MKRVPHTSLEIKSVERVIHSLRVKNNDNSKFCSCVLIHICLLTLRFVPSATSSPITGGQCHVITSHDGLTSFFHHGPPTGPGVPADAQTAVLRFTVHSLRDIKMGRRFAYCKILSERNERGVEEFLFLLNNNYWLFCSLWEETLMTRFVVTNCG